MSDVGKVVPFAPPAPAKWRAFDVFVSDCDALVARIDRWHDPEQKLSSAALERDNCLDQVAAAKEGFRRFNPKAVYDAGGDLRHSHIAKVVGLMFEGFDDKPSSGFVKLMVETISSIDDLSALALESAVREIIKRKPSCRVIATVVAVIEEHIELWNDRERACRYVEQTRLLMIRTLRQREEEAKAEERNYNIRCARSRVAGQARHAQGLSKQIEAARAKLAELTAEHAKAEAWEAEAREALREVEARYAAGE